MNFKNILSLIMLCGIVFFAVCALFPHLWIVSSYPSVMTVLGLCWSIISLYVIFYSDNKKETKNENFNSTTKAVVGMCCVIFVLILVLVVGPIRSPVTWKNFYLVVIIDVIISFAIFPVSIILLTKFTERRNKNGI